MKSRIDQILASACCPRQNEHNRCAYNHVTIILQRCQKNNKKCRSSSSLSHFLFPRDFSGIITNRDIINTPLEPLGPADVPSGGFVDIAPYFGGGWNPPKTPIFGPWIGVFKPNVQNIESFMLSKHLHRFRLNFCTTTETVKWSSWVVPIGAQHIQDGGRPPFWKHR